MHPATQTPKDERSLGDLLAELSQEVITLVRQELTLAKAEMSQKASHIGKQVGVLVAGGALAYAGVLAIVAALVILLDRVAGMPLWLSALLVGIAAAVIGASLVKKGIAAIRQEDLAPRQTLETLKH